MTGEKIRGFATSELHYQNYHVLYLVKHVEKSFEHLRVSQNYQNSNTTADKSTDWHFLINTILDKVSCSLGIANSVTQDTRD